MIFYYYLYIKLYILYYQNESKSAHELAYDRPSYKFVSFLNRYYNLTKCKNINTIYSQTQLNPTILLYSKTTFPLWKETKRLHDTKPRERNTHPSNPSSTTQTHLKKNLPLSTVETSKLYHEVLKTIQTHHFIKTVQNYLVLYQDQVVFLDRLIHFHQPCLGLFQLEGLHLLPKDIIDPLRLQQDYATVIPPCLRLLGRLFLNIINLDRQEWIVTRFFFIPPHLIKRGYKSSIFPKTLFFIYPFVYTYLADQADVFLINKILRIVCNIGQKQRIRSPDLNLNIRLKNYIFIRSRLVYID